MNVEAIILHTSNEKEVSVTPPSSILDSASNEVTFTVATKVSDYSLKYQFILLIKVTSSDKPYNFNNTFDVEVY